MKKLFLIIGLVFSACLIYAGTNGNNWENVGDVQISTVNSPAGLVNPVPLAIDNPGNGTRDCFTKLSFSGDNFPAAGATVRLISTSSTTAAGAQLANATTFYSLTWTTGTIVDYWDYQNPLCSPAPGTTTYLTVSTGNYKVNASGFIRNR